MSSEKTRSKNFFTHMYTPYAFDHTNFKKFEQEIK